MRTITEKEKIELRKELKDMFVSGKLETLKNHYLRMEYFTDWYTNAIIFIGNLSIESIDSIEIDNVIAQEISNFGTEIHLMII